MDIIKKALLMLSLPLLLANFTVSKAEEPSSLSSADKEIPYQKLSPYFVEERAEEILKLIKKNENSKKLTDLSKTPLAKEIAQEHLVININLDDPASQKKLFWVTLNTLNLYINNIRKIHPSKGLNKDNRYFNNTYSIHAKQLLGIVEGGNFFSNVEEGYALFNRIFTRSILDLEPIATLNLYSKHKINNIIKLEDNHRVMLYGGTLSKNDTYYKYSIPLVLGYFGNANPEAGTELLKLKDITTLIANPKVYEQNYNERRPSQI